MVVGQLQLDRGKPRGRSRTEALDQRTLGEEIREIGGKPGHDTFVVWRSASDGLRLKRVYARP